MNEILFGKAAGDRFEDRGGMTKHQHKWKESHREAGDVFWNCLDADCDYTRMTKPA